MVDFEAHRTSQTLTEATLWPSIKALGFPLSVTYLFMSIIHILVIGPNHLASHLSSYEIKQDLCALNLGTLSLNSTILNPRVLTDCRDENNGLNVSDFLLVTN